LLSLRCSKGWEKIVSRSGAFWLLSSLLLKTGGWLTISLFLLLNTLQLRWYNPYAAMLWSAHSSLKGICDKLCQPEFAAARALSTSGQKGAGDSEEEGLASYMPKSLVSLEFGKIFSPMLSERTGFDRLLDSLSHRHREFIASEKAKGDSSHVHPDSLAFKHPAFTVEPKLDGERFLVHIGRNGVVKMHTRKGNWYS